MEKPLEQTQKCDADNEDDYENVLSKTSANIKGRFDLCVSLHIWMRVCVNVCIRHVRRNPYNKPKNEMLIMKLNMKICC